MIIDLIAKFLCIVISTQKGKLMIPVPNTVLAMAHSIV